MHVRLPAPLHGWRSLAGEIGVIVIGVLIALAAQQMAQDWQQRGDLQDARQALLLELRDDDLPQAYARVALSSCLDEQLQAVTRAADAGAGRGEVNRIASAYEPPVRTWDSQAYDAAVASGALTHDGPNELMRWASVYSLLPMIRIAGSDEDHLIGDLAIADDPTRITMLERSRLVRTVHSLQRANRHLNVTGQILLRVAHKAGVNLSDQQKSRVLAELRRAYGTCVRDPGQVDDVTAGSQLSAIQQHRTATFPGANVATDSR